MDLLDNIENIITTLTIDDLYNIYDRLDDLKTNISYEIFYKEIYDKIKIIEKEKEINIKENFDLLKDCLNIIQDEDWCTFNSVLNLTFTNIHSKIIHIRFHDIIVFVNNDGVIEKCYNKTKNNYINSCEFFKKNNEIILLLEKEYGIKNIDVILLTRLICDVQIFQNNI